MISRIIKVSVRVISRSIRLITPTSTLIILDIIKTSFNDCFYYSFILLFIDLLFIDLLFIDLLFIDLLFIDLLFIDLLFIQNISTFLIG